MAGTLLLFPLLALARPSVWVLLGATGVSGALFVHYAWRAGESRGAFRRVFARVKAERRAARVLVPEAASVAPPRVVDDAWATRGLAGRREP